LHAGELASPEVAGALGLRNLVSAASFDRLSKEVDAMYSIFPIEPLLLLRAIAALMLAAAKLLDGMRERMPLTHGGRNDASEEGPHK
jgi:hypothetical protein